jgi:hypothetical protein
LTEEEGASLAQVISVFLVAERLLDLPRLWAEIEETPLPEMVRVELFAIAAKSVRSHLSDILRAVGGETRPSVLCKLLEPGVRRISTAAAKLIRSEVRNEAAARREKLVSLGATDDIVKGLVRLFELDGIFGVAALAARKKMDELALTRAYTKLGEALGIDWAQQQLARFMPADQWERLLTAGLERDFEQLRIDFLSRFRGKEPDQAVEDWVSHQGPRLEQFRNLIDRARTEGAVSAPMLAKASERLEIGRFVKVGHGEELSGGRRKRALLADTFEAVLAAIFLDGGFTAATDFGGQAKYESIATRGADSAARKAFAELRDDHHSDYRPQYRRHDRELCNDATATPLPTDQRIESGLTCGKSLPSSASRRRATSMAQPLVSIRAMWQ